MSHESPEPETTFGYLSAVKSAEHGYFGGFLIVSAAGRPLEFHCTAPVMPSRAQQILYGPTLHPYLIGDQIGATLLAAAKLSPRIILTDQHAAAGLRGRSGVPIVLVLGSFDCRPEPRAFAPETYDDHDHSPPSGQLAAATYPLRPAWSHPFAVANQRLQLPLGYESEQAAAASLLQILSERVELAEPFDRIHEAIREAQRIGGRGADPHAQAA